MFISIYERIVFFPGKKSKRQSKQSSTTSASDSMEESDTESGSCGTKHVPNVVTARRPSLLQPLGRQHHYGSFYLRMGAVGKVLQINMRESVFRKLSG